MMRRTDDLRRQHCALADIAAKLDQAIAALGIVPGAGQVRDISYLIARLTGLLTIHLAREDRYLYPKLIAASDTRVANVAKAFVAEMGHLGTVYGSFAQSWSAPPAIAAEPGRFRSEARVILDLLVRRIHREETELYPLADMLQPGKREAA